MNRRATLARTSAFAAVSLPGGLVALGVALVGDLGGGATTVVRTSPSPTASAQVADDNRLSV